MLIPDGESVSEIVIRKSRFIGRAVTVSSASDARLIVKRQKKEQSGCSHVVYAFISGKKGEIFGLSDDGEPSGTAGRPVLEVLKGSGITDIIITVTRYFGGTKLGTGGLVKAYTESAKETLSTLRVVEFVEKTGFNLNLSYNLYDPAVKQIELLKGEITDTDFAADIRIEGILPQKNAVELRRILKDLSKGKITLFLDDADE